MKLHKTTFNKASLAKIPIEEQILFIQAGRFLNDFMVFHKLVSVAYKKYRNDTELKAKNVQTFSILLKMVGILYEGGNFIRRNLNDKGFVRHYSADLDKEYLTILNELLLYFSGNNVVSTIRNKIGFHYLDHKVREQLIGMKDGYSLEIYFSDFHANCLYHSSHIITLCSVLDLVDPADHERAWNTLLQEILDVSGKFIDLLGEIVSVFVKKHNKCFSSLEEIEVDDPVKLDDIELPFFVMR